MAWENLLYEQKGSVGVIILNRVEKMNALNAQLLSELSELLENCANDDSIRALIITGSGKAFCAGGDISRDDAGDPLGTFIKFSCLTRDTLHQVETCKKPVIAAINGYAFGGGIELALCCDLRVASEKAKMGMTEVKLGVVPGAGGTQRLPRLIGMAMAKQLMYTGGIIDGTEAYRIGLVNIVTPPEECLNKALQLAEEIASMAPLAVQASKKCINMSMQVDLESGLSYEAECVRGVFTSADRLEGGNAFREKRPPVWKGR